MLSYSLNLYVSIRGGCMMDRLKEPSSWGGLGLIATGIASLLSHDYATGTAQIITGLMAVLRPEAISGAK